MIPFVKAHACGNDFLVIQENLAGVEPRDELTRRLCQRNSGVGADGVEFLTWEGKRQGRIRLHNADGSIAEISGNGTRCAAAWIAYETKGGPGDEIVLETDAGPRVVEFNARFGDPETQVMMPRVGGDFARYLASAAEGAIELDAARFSDDASLTS